MSATGPGTRRGKPLASTSEPAHDTPITPGEGSDNSDNMRTILATLAQISATQAAMTASQATIIERLEKLESNSRNSTPMTVPSRDTSVEQPDRPEPGTRPHHLPDPKMPPPEMLFGKPSA